MVVEIFNIKYLQNKKFFLTLTFGIFVQEKSSNS